MMKPYHKLSTQELMTEQQRLLTAYRNIQAQHLSLDMSRGKPSPDQVRLSEPLLRCVTRFDDLICDNVDCGNYGVLDGIPQAKQLMSDLMCVEPDDIFVGGNSSLNLMHDCISYLYTFGAPNSTPWKDEAEIKFLCPVPGYDRHFAISEHFGFTLIAVDMDEHGPIMEQVEELVKDPQVKGMWCVPKYSNPSGISYSDEVIRKLAAMPTAAPDFRIFWDNAYTAHHFDWHHPDTILCMMETARQAGNPDRPLQFISTSKITFPGGGIAAVGASPTNMDWLKRHMSLQTIGYNKIEQLRHTSFLPDIMAVKEHMQKLAGYLLPKFQLVLDHLESLRPLEIATWASPRGGYFIAVDVLDGCAKRIVELCGAAGVKLTPAGSTHPYGVDPKDKTLRIAPTFPPIEELAQAATLLVLCIQIASVEHYLNQ